MHNRLIIILLLLTWIGTGCHSHEHDPILEKAFEVHNAALKVSASISDQILALEKDSTTLSIRAELDSIKVAHDDWLQQVIEVPGFDHHDHEGEHHHHHHGGNYLDDLPPEDMLEVQKEMKKQIEQLRKAVEDLGGAK